MGREGEGTRRGEEGALPSNPGPPVGSGSSGIGGNQPERVRGSIVIQGHPTRSMSNPAIVVNDMLCNTAAIILWFSVLLLSSFLFDPDSLHSLHDLR